MSLLLAQDLGVQLSLVKEDTESNAKAGKNTESFFGKEEKEPKTVINMSVDNSATDIELVSVNDGNGNASDADSVP